MKKIAIIIMGVKLKGEKGFTRWIYLAEFLAKAGFQVDLITSTFRHSTKSQRDIKKAKEVSYPFTLKFIYEPGYKKNIDFKRIQSHGVAAKSLRTLLDTEGDYDLMFAAIPPNNVALVAGEYAKEQGIPFIVDVSDLWPEAMRMVLDIPVVSDILFHPFTRDAEKVYALASGVVGTSDEYRDRPFKNQDRDIPRITVYVGNDLDEFDAAVKKNQNMISKPEEEFWIGYAGSIGTSYDIKTLILAGEELARRGRDNVRIKILGDGPTKESLEDLAKTRQISNVEFLGYTPYDQMAAYLTKCDVLINSYVKKAPQSIVTKIADYLAAGKPMINTCSSLEFRNKVDADGFGINIEAEDVNILADAIESFVDNPKQCEEMSKKARIIAEEQFDRKKSYDKIRQLIDQLT